MEGWDGLAGADDGYSLHICPEIPHSMVTTTMLATLAISSPSVALALSLAGQS